MSASPRSALIAQARNPVVIAGRGRGGFLRDAFALGVLIEAVSYDDRSTRLAARARAECIAMGDDDFADLLAGSAPEGSEAP